MDECLAGLAAGNGQTVLVGGIETFLDVLEPAEAQNFLKAGLSLLCRNSRPVGISAGWCSASAHMRDLLR